jgi:hypothetical protein
MPQYATAGAHVAMTEPAMFAIPAGPAVQLDVEPRLASWNTAGDRTR